MISYGNILNRFFKNLVGSDIVTFFTFLHALYCFFYREKEIRMIRKNERGTFFMQITVLQQRNAERAVAEAALSLKQFDHVTNGFICDWL